MPNSRRQKNNGRIVLMFMHVTTLFQSMQCIYSFPRRKPCLCVSEPRVEWAFLVSTLWYRKKTGQALQAGRSRFRFSMRSVEFFIDLILQAAYGPVVDLPCKTNESKGYLLGGGGGVNAAGVQG
jgi:hypothetical protein